MEEEGRGQADGEEEERPVPWTYVEGHDDPDDEGDAFIGGLTEG